MLYPRGIALYQYKVAYFRAHLSHNIQYKYYALQGKSQADIACALAFLQHKHS